MIVQRGEKMKPRGFEVTINGTVFTVRCRNYISCTKANESDVSLKAQMQLQIYQNGKLIHPDANSYVAEKIVDYIATALINMKEIEV